ncbi:hypothetical protein HAP41_0000048350 (plasmid) [Bradyrhizobium barranii subsp. apii]|uniref:Uncharacterized protein n=1 Tax=Bradyrhizobium barranii subsp. apii TaxID=2819348 RepID=A0A8T5VJJ7_9BRAD|nr:hypothetical protein [Bradyrhizobium barranii]UPT92111.1 hypothetical protein HAP41_0000048350 [Bradyrhizobium barranii subsp. apii]
MQQQMDLFGGGLSNGALGAPAWSELPGEARAALTSLMTQLMLDHAAMTATPPAKGAIMISDKVRPHHLERKAILYVRQSSAHQVLHNRVPSNLRRRCGKSSSVCGNDFKCVPRRPASVISNVARISNPPVQPS